MVDSTLDAEQDSAPIGRKSAAVGAPLVSGLPAAGEPAPLAKTSTAALACLGVAVVAFAIFSRALFNDFVEFDDNAYVTDNEHVQQGITLESLKWVLTANVGCNWHPLTMLSHMLDCQLYGLAPWGHHLTGILFHAANTGLCGWLWYRMTGRLGSSLAVAALFGWHPLRVESVAWVAERKDVLSTFFGLLAILAYVGWTRRPAPSRYALMLFWTIASLMSKPMLVTLPCVLLLLDYWPLRRLSEHPSALDIDPAKCRQAVWEKLPLFGLSLLLCVITYLAQSELAVRSLEQLPLNWRLLNAASVYCRYLSQTLWPSNLAVFYPHPSNRLPIDQALLAVTALVVFTLAIVQQRAARPYLAVGWLWYLGTLVPVIGLVQVGGAAHADRYTYLPLIGIFMLAVWLSTEWGASSPIRQRLVALGWTAWIVVLAGLTWRQIGLWRNPITLFTHTAAVTPGNFVAPYVLGMVEFKQRRFEPAIEHFERSLEFRPSYGLAWIGKANCLNELGRFREAAEAYRRAEMAGELAAAERLGYAYVLVRDRQFREAEAQFNLVQVANPLSLDPNLGMAISEARQGRTDDAVARLRRVLAAQPHQPLAVDRLVRLMVAQPGPTQRRSKEAVSLAKAASEHSPDDAALHDTWAIALAAAGEFTRAIEQAETAKQLATQQLAIPAEPSSGGVPNFKHRELTQLKADLETRLDLFRRRQAYVEDPQECRLPPGF